MTASFFLDRVVFYTLKLNIMNVLEIEDLSKNYRFVTALNHLFLTIKKGEIWGVLGPNGSGKTTTLAIVSGIIRANSGSFKWFGKSYKPELMKKVGVLIETPNFYPYLSIEKNLKIQALIKEVPFSDIERVLKIVNLFERKNSPFNTMSLGMKQRLAIAGALLGNPEVLILDEPTNGLDPQGISEVREIIQGEARKGRTIILASHILSEVEKVCSHVAILKKGNLLAQGKVSDLLVNKVSYNLGCDNAELLAIELSKASLIDDFKVIDANSLNISLLEGIEIAQVNKYAYENGYVLTEITKGGLSLEQEFINLIKQ